jgi:hypothetical protein
MFHFVSYWRSIRTETLHKSMKLTCTTCILQVWLTNLFWWKQLKESRCHKLLSGFNGSNLSFPNTEMHRITWKNVSQKKFCDKRDQMSHWTKNVFVNWLHPPQNEILDFLLTLLLYHKFLYTSPLTLSPHKWGMACSLGHSFHLIHLHFDFNYSDKQLTDWSDIR